MMISSHKPAHGCAKNVAQGEGRVQGCLVDVWALENVEQDSGRGRRSAADSDKRRAGAQPPGSSPWLSGIRTTVHADLLQYRLLSPSSQARGTP